MSVLNKFLAQSGIASRRKSIDLIKEGLVMVNNQVMQDPAYRVQDKDKILVRGVAIKREKKIYVLLNKPNNFITTVSDERGRKTVMDLIQDAGSERMFPVGRLDRTTTGLLLMTNDGELMQKLAHPRNRMQKIYHVTLNQELTIEHLEKIKQGLMLYDGRAQVDAISFIPRARRNELKVTLHSGKNRIVRRIFEYLGYEVKKLDRINYAGLTKKGLLIGEWRYLTKDEIDQLYA